MLLVACFVPSSASGSRPAGAASMVAVFDRLAERGVITDAEHGTLVDGVHALDAAVRATLSGSAVVALAALTAALVVVAVHLLHRLALRAQGAPA